MPTLPTYLEQTLPEKYTDEQCSYFFEGENGENWVKKPIPQPLQPKIQEERAKLLDQLSFYIYSYC